MNERALEALKHLESHPWSKPCTPGCLARWRGSSSAGPEVSLHPRAIADGRRSLDGLVMLGYAYQLKSTRPPARYRIREAGRRVLGYPDEREP